MITRAKLVEQLREYQIRSQHKYSALVFFSPKPQIRTWADVTVAILLLALFSILEKGKKNVITSVYVNMSIQLQSKVLPVIPCYVGPSFKEIRQGNDEFHLCRKLEFVGQSRLH
ncbi:hypothetical protein ACET3Z_018058 [Daucus carota]